MSSPYFGPLGPFQQQYAYGPYGPGPALYGDAPDGYQPQPAFTPSAAYYGPAAPQDVDTSYQGYYSQPYYASSSSSSSNPYFTYQNPPQHQAATPPKKPILKTKHITNLKQKQPKPASQLNPLAAQFTQMQDPRDEIPETPLPTACLAPKPKPPKTKEEVIPTPITFDMAVADSAVPDTVSDTVKKLEPVAFGVFAQGVSGFDAGDVVKGLHAAMQPIHLPTEPKRSTSKTKASEQLTPTSAELVAELAAKGLSTPPLKKLKSHNDEVPPAETQYTWADAQPNPGLQIDGPGPQTGQLPSKPSFAQALSSPTKPYKAKPKPQPVALTPQQRVAQMTEEQVRRRFMNGGNNNRWTQKHVAKNFGERDVLEVVYQALDPAFKEDHSPAKIATRAIASDSFVVTEGIHANNGLSGLKGVHVKLEPKKGGIASRMPSDKTAPDTYHLYMQNAGDPCRVQDAEQVRLWKISDGSKEFDKIHGIYKDYNQWRK